MPREVQLERFPYSYWRHLEFNLGRCEDYWQSQADAASGRARPDLEQAGGGSSLPTALTSRKERKDDDEQSFPVHRESP